IQQVTDKILHLQELRNEITQMRDNKLAENERALADIETARRDISELESQLQVVLNERGELSRAEAELRRERDELMTVLREHERKGRDARGVKDSAVAQAHKLDLRISQIDSESAALLERIDEEYSLDPRAFVQPVDSELPPLEGPEALKAARQTVHDLKQRIKSYGAVNLLALEEHGAATERYEKLATQVEDLINAKNTLQSTISKINKTARELFAETFDKARENFKSIFTELFDGGECDIRLRDESDPLESDIEIHARPKGKKLVTITQMSGGERALTAISLLFSLYLVKPSPFCILDEIDAPLDDANCHRFLRLIRRFSNQTQFIVITHNKITMEAADTLYGVTMESAGVSKLVSVHFAEDGEGGTRLVPIAEIESANGGGNGGGNGAARQDSIARVAPERTSEPEIPQAVVERMKTTVTTVEPTEAAIRLSGDRAEADEPTEADD
ncbi:MAG TPA: AAA family ATPase, partial [candidate division Zixibacteria bacterium]|nr:AAA family ATPase [candidate division Zixibacteria bacterium]